MNKIIIANYRETEPQVISREGNSFAVKPVIREADASAVLAASLFHYKELEIRQVKEYLKNCGIPVRMWK